MKIFPPFSPLVIAVGLTSLLSKASASQMRKRKEKSSSDQRKEELFELVKKKPLLFPSPMVQASLKPKAKGKRWAHFSFFWSSQTKENKSFAVSSQLKGSVRSSWWHKGRKIWEGEGYIDAPTQDRQGRVAWFLIFFWKGRASFFCLKIDYDSITCKITWSICTIRSYRRCASDYPCIVYTIGLCLAGGGQL